MTEKRISAVNVYFHRVVLVTTQYCSPKRPSQQETEFHQTQRAANILPMCTSWQESPLPTGNRNQDALVHATVENLTPADARFWSLPALDEQPCVGQGSCCYLHLGEKASSGKIHSEGFLAVLLP